MASEFGADNGSGDPLAGIARLTWANCRANLTAIDAVLKALPTEEGRSFAAASLEVRAVARRLRHTVRDLEDAIAEIR